MDDESSVEGADNEAPIKHIRVSFLNEDNENEKFDGDMTGENDIT